MDWRPDTSPGALLWRASNMWQRQLRRALRPHGLTQAQFLILVSLQLFEEQNPSTTQQDLAAFCGLDVAAISTVLRQLVDRGYAARRPGADARVRHPELTPAGARLVAAVALRAVIADRDVFSPLGKNVPMFRGALQLLLGMRPRMSSR